MSLPDHLSRFLEMRILLASEVLKLKQVAPLRHLEGASLCLHLSLQRSVLLA